MKSGIRNEESVMSKKDQESGIRNEESGIRNQESGKELMELIKKYRAVIVVVLIILVLILIRSTGINHFKNDSKKWAEPSVKQSNIITVGKAGLLPGKILIINLDKSEEPAPDIPGEFQNIHADSLLRKDHISFNLKHDGPVLLLSSDRGLSARIWMLLSQMGRRNMFILSDSENNEVLKYKFRPDTLPGAKF